MPRTVRDTLPDAPMARLGGDKLLSSGMELRQNLLQAGILYMMDPEEERQLGLACLSHREHAGEQRSEQFARFCDSIGVTTDFSCSEPLFSLAKYRQYFDNVVYILRDHPGGDVSWPFLRCSCVAFSKHASCEHVEHCRTLNIPLMQDAPTSTDMVGERSRRGRPCGSHSAAKMAVSTV